MTARQSSALGGLVVDISRRLHEVETHPPDQAALAAEAQARAKGDAAVSKAVSDESTARAAGDKAIGDAVAAEAQARAKGDDALAARLPVKLSGTLSLPASLALAAGKTLRTVAVQGLKAGDDITVTPKAALPAGLALAETYCLADGVLSVALIATALVTIAAKTDIPLGIVALR